MDLNVLRLLLDVSRHGSFAAAARLHDLAPSTVSREIAGLESELGVRLFQRTTRKLSPTEAGERYLRQISPIVEALERAIEEAQLVNQQPSGSLRLTTSVAFGHECLVPLLGEFRQRFPEISLEFMMTDSNVDLIESGLDLAVRLGPPPDVGLIGTKLVDTAYRVVATPEYLKQSEAIVSPDDLANHACVLFSLAGFSRSWRFRGAGGGEDEVAVTGKLTISNALSLREAVRQHLGPALLANWMVDRDIASGRLVNVFPGYRVTATSFETGAWLLYPSRSFLPQKVRVMIDYLKQRLGKTLPGPPT